MARMDGPDRGGALRQCLAGRPRRPGQRGEAGASVEMLIDDIQVELVGRPYELSQVSGGWMFRTKTQFADAIKAAADLGDQQLAFTEMEMGVLCAIAYHQPIDRAGWPKSSARRSAAICWLGCATRT